MESDIITPETYTEYKAKLLADPNYQYFMTYQFQGMDNCKDITWKAFTNAFSHDSSFFDSTLFRHDCSHALTANEMVNYTISYMACVTAIDMFAKKCKTTDHIFKGEQGNYRLFYASYIPVEDRMTFTFETANSSTRLVLTWDICVICDNYITLNRPLNRRISITGSGLGSHINYMGLCKDTNFDLIEDLIRQGGY